MRSISEVENRLRHLHFVSFEQICVQESWILITGQYLDIAIDCSNLVPLYEGFHSYIFISPVKGDSSKDARYIPVYCSVNISCAT